MEYFWIILTHCENSRKQHVAVTHAKPTYLIWPERELLMYTYPGQSGLFIYVQQRGVYECLYIIGFRVWSSIGAKLPISRKLLSL